LFRFNRFRINIHHSVGQLSAGRFEDQLGTTLAGPIADARIGAAFEAIARFAAEAELFAGATDISRQKISALDEYIDGLLVDLRVRAAHDTGQGDAFLFVGNQQHFARERAVLVVERLEFFLIGGATNDDGGLIILAFGDEMIVERMQRLADFEHDVVGDVDNVVDAADADLFQSGPQPIRAGPDLYAFDDAGGVAGTKGGVFDANIDETRSFEF